MSMLDGLKQIDQSLFLTLNGCHSPFFDTFFWLVSNKYIWIPLYLLLIYFIIRKYKKQSWIIILSAILVIVLTDQTSVHLFKNMFMRYRPSHNLSLQGLVHIVNNYRGGLYGFVSSHAANSFGIAVFTALFMKNKWYWLCILLWAILVSYSRIYLGVHYPADITGGAILGSFWAVIFFFFTTKLLKSNNNTKCRYKTG